ncbi:MAG: hypothetical protein E7140_05280 [Rikenellaceae bacterium]|nr:hypothetical protein [Rikenellaceae bacterium]
MSAELQRDIRKILVEDFSEAIGFDKETGLLPNGKKRFAGMPFVGFRYSEQTPKILIVGEDIGSDECVNDNAKDINGTPLYFHDFDSKRKNSVNVAGKYYAHLAGTYMTALYLLRNCDKFKDMWEESMCEKTAHWALKMLSASQIAKIAHAIALTNLHKFVAVVRKGKSGDQDRNWIDYDKEFAIFIEEVKCFAPDIIILQAINSVSEAEIEQIKQAVKGVAVYKLTHPSTRRKGGRIVQNLIIDPLRKQGYKEEKL